MYLDKQTLLSDSQALTTGTIVSTNIYDTGAAEDPGIGGDLDLFLAIKETFVGGTSVTITLQTATDAAFTSPVTLWTTPAIVTASLAAGTQLYLPTVPIGALRYLRLSYAISGTYSAGKVSTGIVIDRQAWQPVAGNQPV